MAAGNGPCSNRKHRTHQPHDPLPLRNTRSLAFPLAAKAYSLAPAKWLGAAAMPSLPPRMAQDENHSAADAVLRESLAAVLGLEAGQVAGFEAATPLFGALPEIDSMAVATLLTDFEDRLGIVIDDDDVDAESFETFGTLRDFLARKIATKRH